MIRNFTKTEAAWLAAVIDGEGSIGLYTYKHDGRRCLIQMANTSRPFVARMRKIIGAGSQIGRSKFGPSHKGRKPMFFYALKGSKRCHQVLTQLLPFLIIKKSKARKIVRELERKPFGRWGQYVCEKRS